MAITLITFLLNSHLGNVFHHAKKICVKNVFSKPDMDVYNLNVFPPQGQETGSG